MESFYITAAEEEAEAEENKRDKTDDQRVFRRESHKAFYLCESTHQDLDSLLHHQGGVVGGLTHSHYGGDSVLLQLLENGEKK